MEELRSFERVCLRACLGKHRDPETNFKTMLSNKKIYDESDITRIDNFIIKLTRNHISHSLKNDENPLIKEPFLLELDSIDRMIAEGLLPLGTFPRLDQLGYIQDNKNIPIIYHIKRHAFDKKLKYNKHDLNNLPNKFMVLSTALPKKDILDKSHLNTKKYPWLNVR